MRARLRALPACGGRHFPGLSVGRALRLTWGAACSAQQPRRTALNSRVPIPNRKAQDEREVYSAAILRGERGSVSDRSGKPQKTAQIQSFPHCGNILSIVWKNPENFFHCVEKTANVFPLCGKIAESISIAWKKRACFSTVWKHFFHSVEKSRKSFP